jgi:nucleotide-binding universal stress UspA family protein
MPVQRWRFASRPHSQTALRRSFTSRESVAAAKDRQVRSIEVKQTSRILVAVDSSRPSSAAFDQALALSARSGSELVVVHAVSKDWPYSWRASERVSALASLRERAEAQNVRVLVRSQQGDAAKVILLHARAHDPDLIVLGSHQPVGRARLRFRSVADRVVKGATWPVLLVPAGMTSAASAFSNVLYAADSPSGANRVLTTAAQLASASGGRLVLLHVLPDPVLRHRAHFAVPEFGRLMLRDARERLDSMLKKNNVAADVRVTVTDATTHDEIVRVAAEEQADIVVIGSTRRTSLGRRLFGSTGVAVSRRSARPVLIVPTEHAKRAVNPQDELALGWAA